MTVTTLAMLGASTPVVQAHGGWSIAGKVLTGVGAGLLISRALEPRPVPVYVGTPVYVNPAPVVVQQPAQVVVQQPAPQVVVQQPAQQVVVQQPAPATTAVVQTQPTVVQTQPVVVQQPTVVYQSAPVVYAPAPVIYSAPVYTRPYYYGPVIGFRFGFGHPYHHYRHW